MRADDDAGRAHAAWQEFHDDLADFGVTSRPSEPPVPWPPASPPRWPETARGDHPHGAGRRARQLRRPSGRSADLRRDGTAARRGLAARPAASPAGAPPSSRLDDHRPGRSRRADPRPSARFGACTRVMAGRRARRLPAGWSAGATSCGHPPAGGASALPSAPSSGPAWSAPGGRARPRAWSLSLWSWHAAGRTLATCRRQLTTAHIRDSSATAAPAASRYTRWVTTPAASRPAPTATPIEALGKLALIVHARIAGAHETPELRILPVQRLLDLLQLALLMFRERHDASHKKTLAPGTCVR